MAQHCPTCSTVCYCGGDHSEIIQNVPYCRCCGEKEAEMDDLDTDDLATYAEITNQIKKQYMHTPGTIYAIDFDGTVVTHEFPKVGKDVPYAVETLQKIVAHGGKLILWTMRSNHTEPPEFTTEPQHERNPIIECDPDAYLDHAIKWFTDREIPLWGIQRNPDQDKWTSSPKAYAHVYIDDAALGTHVKQDDFSDRPYVDWVLVDAFLFPEEH